MSAERIVLARHNFHSHRAGLTALRADTFHNFPNHRAGLSALREERQAGFGTPQRVRAEVGKAIADFFILDIHDKTPTIGYIRKGVPCIQPSLAKLEDVSEVTKTTSPEGLARLQNWNTTSGMVHQSWH